MNSRLDWGKVEKELIRLKPSDVGAIQFICVGGSHASGTARKNSDIDVVICIAGEKTIKSMSQCIEVSPTQSVLLDAAYISFDILESSIQNGPPFLSIMNRDGFYLGEGDDEKKTQFLDLCNQRIAKEKEALKLELQRFPFDKSVVKFQIEMLEKKGALETLSSDQHWHFTSRFDNFLERYAKHVYYFLAMKDPNNAHLETYLLIRQQELYRIVKLLEKDSAGDWSKFHKDINVIYGRGVKSECLKEITKIMDDHFYKLFNRKIFDADISNLVSDLPFIIWPI